MVGSGLDASGRERALRWAPDGTVTALADPPGAGSVSASAITRDGRFIAGRLSDGKNSRLLRWDSTGAVTMLGPEGQDSWFADMNASGEIVGRTTINDRYAAVKWTATGQMIELAWGNSYSSDVYAINNAGVAVGMGYIDTSGTSGPARWAGDGTLTLLSSGAGTARDIDFEGRVVGATDRPALWDRNGVRTDLAVLPGSSGGQAELIGRDGTIAGGMLAADGHWHAVYWPAR